MKLARATRGFGLIEVMISAAMLAVGMAAIMSLFSNLEDNYRHQRLVSTALHVGEAQMEDLLLRFATDPDLTAGTTTGPSFTLDGRVGGTFFTTSWTVVQGVPVAGTRQITLTVQWTERGQQRRLSLTTVRT